MRKLEKTYSGFCQKWEILSEFWQFEFELGKL
jgi:hypothetical protein